MGIKTAAAPQKIGNRAQNESAGPGLSKGGGLGDGKSGTVVGGVKSMGGAG
jgi:hypothetical protein